MRWLWLLLVLGVAACAGQPEAAPVTVTSTLEAATETPVPATATSIPDSSARADERNHMIATQIQIRGVEDPAVIAAMRSVPRHLFVPESYQTQAYDDHPLPIGYGQTISQPYIVAVMTEALQLTPDMRVLEIGTGSGYQAAILAEIVAEVYTVEIVEPLAEQAGSLLDSLGYDNVHVLRADGYYGWEEHAPFDAIIVTAAPDHVPQPLVLQLGDNGRLIIPVGPVGSYQQLWLLGKVDGEVQPAISLGDVVFVPFTRESE